MQPQKPKRKQQKYAVVGTEIQPVNERDVDYEMESPNKFFGTHSNLVPLQSSVASPRVSYGSRFISQAVPLRNHEAPLVQSLMDDDENGRSFEDYAGDQAGNIRSKNSGKVVDIKDNEITLLGDDNKKYKYDLYNNFAFNRKTSLTNTPLVQKGDQISEGQLLAKSNFTDDKGQLALGTNARTAIVPYKGFSMDDAIAVSQDFANKLSSEQMLTFSDDKKGDKKFGKRHFLNLFPNKYTRKQLAKLDENGVAKPNQVLEKGDPVILSTSPKIISSENQHLGKLSRHMIGSRKDASKTWDHDTDGQVTDAATTNSNVKLNIKSFLPAQEGDKIVYRQGQKGVISKVLPREHMPRSVKDGEPMEVLLNPLSLPSRVNNSLVYELLLGKVAKKRGEPYKAPQFNNKDEEWFNLVSDELKKHGVSDTEKLYDPQEDKVLSNPVTVGNGNILKLSHMSESKLSGRGFGAYSTTDQQPLKGGGENAGAKRLSSLETSALLSSGGYNALREAATLRGSRNDAYWRALREGLSPKDPTEPFAWDKFKTLITGAGLHADEVTQDKLRLSPMTDKKLENLKPTEIKNGQTINLSTFEPVKDGLFDPKINTTNKWGQISLDFPIPNPAFERQITKLLGMKNKDLENVIQGKPVEDEKVREKLGGKTGTRALKDALSKIDPEQMKKESLDVIKKKKKTQRPLAIQRLNYLKGLEKNGLKPSDLMVNKVPVIPPKFRPFSVVGDTFVPGDSNELYRDLIDVNNAYRETKDILGEENAGEEADSVYKAAKAVYGYGEPVNTKTRERGVSGFLEKLVGKSPKYSWLQRKLTSKTTDLSGRSVVTVNPELKLDEVGIPEELAWKTYQPFINRNLVKRGLPMAKAVKEVRDKTDLAKQALYSEIKRRPLMYTRSPSWHKFNVIGGWPKLTAGKNIQVNPLVTEGLNMDFDGDDQINKVLILIDLHKNFGFVKKNPYLIFTTHDNKGNFLPMFKKLHIPTFNPKNYALAAVDLEDFPHGEFSNTVDGHNGPIYYYHAAPGTKVIAYNEETNKPEWADVSYYSVHPDREVEIVNLSNRKQIITDDDPRAVYGVDAAKGFTLERFTPSDALAKKVAVPVVKNIESLTDNGNLTEIEITDNKECPFQKLPLDFDFGYFCGAMAGDGWWDKKDYTVSDSRHLYLADLKGHVANALETWIKENIAQSGKFYSNVHKDYKSSDLSRYGDSVKYRWNFPHSTELTIWLSKHFGGNSDDKTAGSGNKRLPDFLCNAAKSYRAGVFCGLMDTDGSISTSHAKSKPQLMTSFTSTSLRLVRDIQMLAFSIGVRGTISHSKTTSCDNDSWILTFKSGDIKNTGVLDKVVTPSKKEALEQGVVTDQNGTAIVDNKVVFPASVKEKLSPYIECPKIRPEERENADSLKKWLQNVYQQWYAARNDSTISKPSAGKILGMVSYHVGRSVEDWSAARKKLLSMSRHSSAEVTSDEIDIIRKGIRASAPSFGDSAVKEQGRKLQSRTSRPKNTGVFPAKVINDILEFLDNNTPHNPLLDYEIKTWEKLINNDDVVWSDVEEVEKTGKKETGYDLTVPGRETFTSLDGIILSNTANVHTPVFDETVEEVKNKLMPSKMLYSIRDENKVMPQPKHETLLGLYATKNNPSKNTYTFPTKEAALQAIKSGKVDLSDNIEIQPI